MKYFRSLLPYILLVLLTASAFANTLLNSFVYDDASVIAENPRVFKLYNVRYVFSPLYFKIVGKGKEYAFGEASYRPAVTLTYFYDALLFNGTSAGCHFTNLLLHISNVLLLYTLISFLLSSRVAALLGAAFFSVHPIVTESVNAIGFREDLLVLSGILAGLLVFLKSEQIINRKNRKKRIIYDSIQCVILAITLFSKESAVVYPVLLMGIMYAKRMRFTKYARLFIMLFLVVAFYFFIRFIIMNNPNETPLVYPGGYFLTNIYTMLKVFYGYIGLLIYPVNLLADHQIPPVRHFSHMIALQTGLIAIFVLTIGYLFLRQRKIWSYGIVWFLISLGPVMNIIKIVNISAERYLYVPLAGIAISIAILFSFLWKRYQIKFLILIIILLSLYTCKTIARNSDWHDTLSLWQATLRVEPKSHRALSNLATYYFDHEQYRKAINYYLKALEQRASSTDRYNLANCYTQIGDFQQAEKEFHKSINLDPTHPETYNNLALLYVKMEQYDDAETTLRKAISYKTPDAGYFENMGLIYDAKGEYDKAIEQLNKSIDLNPRNSSSYNKLAIAYCKKGNIQEGIEIGINAIQKFPDDINLYKNIAIMYSMQGDKQRSELFRDKAHKLEERLKGESHQ